MEAKKYRKHGTREHDEQTVYFKWLAYGAKTEPAMALAFAIPNGGLRNIRVAQKLKAEGVKAGVPDILLPVPRGTFHGLFIEMKIRPNKPTKLQEEWIKRLRDEGYFVKICYNAREAFEITKTYLAYGSDNPTST